MTTRGPSHGLDADQLEEAIAFLATAPKGVEPWATQQTEALQKRLAEVTDEPECFYDDFEDEDDVLSSRKAREKLVGDEPEKMPKGFKLVLAVVLIVGLVVGKTRRCSDSRGRFRWDSYHGLFPGEHGVSG